MAAALPDARIVEGQGHVGDLLARELVAETVFRFTSRRLSGRPRRRLRHDAAVKRAVSAGVSPRLK